MSAAADPQAVYRDALDQMQGYGLDIERIEFSAMGADATDRVRRVRHRDDRPGTKNGWYIAGEVTTTSGRYLIFGSYGSWKEGGHHQIEWDGRGLSIDEQREIDERRKEADAARQEARAKLAAQTAARARAIWAKLPGDGPSKYLEHKRVCASGIRFSRGSAVVPVRTGPDDASLVGLQWIGADGAKRFLTGTAKRGAFALLTAPPGPGEILAIGEGYATAATALMATQWAVAAAFDAGNLLLAAQALARLYPQARLLILADDDHQTKGNPGVTYATAAARAVGALLAVPRFQSCDPDRGTDFNDLYVAEGLEAVRAQLLATVEAADRAAVSDPPAPVAGGTVAPSPVPNSVPPAPGEEEGASPPRRTRGGGGRTDGERAEKGVLPHEPAAPGGGSHSAVPPPPNGGGGSAPEDPRSGGRTIRMMAGELHLAVDDTEHYLIEAGAPIYVSGTRAVRIGNWNAQRGPVKRPTGAGVLLDVTPEWVCDRASRCIRYERFDKRSGDWMPTDCPSKVAAHLLARAGDWRFPTLTGFCDAPILALDGRLVDAPGYDEQSGLYLCDPPKLQPIPAALDRYDAEAAAELLYECVSTFPFVTEGDRAACLAAMLTVLLRRVLPAAPMVAVTAATAGTGKSKLVDVLATIATGRAAATLAMGHDSKEFETRIQAAMLSGDALINVDNVSRPVANADALCQILTQQSISVRVLGLSKIVQVPCNVAIAMTGNNLVLLGDLVRRSLVIALDAGCEQPERRSFEREAVAYALSRRAELIRAAIVLARAYRDCGEPEIDAPPIGSFESWDRLVRRPVMWAGYPDPLAPAEGMRAEDHELGAWKALLPIWQATVPHAETATALHKLAIARVPTYAGAFEAQHPELTDALVQVMGDQGKWSGRDLGYALRRVKGRIFSGLRVIEDGKSHGSAKWRVETV